MTRGPAAGLLAALCVGCAGRCGTPPSASASPDSGATLPAAASAPTRQGLPAVDLRQAILTAVPEFRGMAGLYTVAVVERRYREDFARGGDVAAALAPGFASRGFRPATTDGGPLAAESPPFFLEAFREGGLPVVRVGLVVPGEKVVDLLQTPAPLGSQAMALRMPPPPGDAAVPYDEAFAFEVHYRASVEASDRLMRQLADGLLSSGWTARPGSLPASPDAGWPEALDAQLSGPHGATLSLHRAEGRVTVTWDQPLTSGR